MDLNTHAVKIEHPGKTAAYSPRFGQDGTFHEQKDANNPYLLPATFYVVVDFPHTITYEGKSYYATGKRGTEIATGFPSAQYYDRYGNNWIWMNANKEFSKD